MNTNTTKKTNKKGFTLVELVVVIAILAILAAIAIPVVASTISSATRSSALSNAQTLELALKEADAMIEAGDTSVYAGGANTSVANVFTQKALDIPATVTVDGQTYTLFWDSASDKCVYLTGGTNSTDLNGEAGPTNGLTAITATSTTQVTNLFTANQQAQNPQPNP